MSSSDVVDGTTWAAALAIGVGWLVGSAALFLWFAWALSVVFRKVGSPPWRAWVPVVNVAEIFRLGDQAPWKVLLFFVPVVNLYAFYVHIVAVHRLTVRFGHGAAATVVGVLLAPVWATMLARGHVAAPVPLADRIAPAPDVDMAPRSSSTSGSAEASTPQQVPASAILTDVESDAPRPASTEPPVTAAHEPVVPPRAHPGAPYAVRPLAPEEATEAPPALDFQAPAPEVGQPVRDPWSPAPSSPTPAPIARPVPIEITAPPLAPVKDFALAPDAISALAASMISRGDEDEEDSARPSVIVDEDPEDGETVVVDRRPRITWILSVDGAGEFRLNAERVLLGRKPTSSSPGTQALSIPDATRTLSKLHARLDLTDGAWTITDLNSTNGVLLVASDGAEELIEPGASAQVRGRFILGKVGMSIRYEGELA